MKISELLKKMGVDVDAEVKEEEKKEEISVTPEQLAALIKGMDDEGRAELAKHFVNTEQTQAETEEKSKETAEETTTPKAEVKEEKSEPEIRYVLPSSPPANHTPTQKAKEISEMSHDEILEYVNKETKKPANSLF